MPETMICSFCHAEVSDQLIACPHCGNHFHTRKTGSENEDFQPTHRVQVPYRWLMLTASLLVAAGSLLPWGMMNSLLGRMVINGDDGDGVLTAGIAGLLFVVAFFPERSSKSRRLVYIAGSVICGVVLIPKLFWFIPDPALEGSGLTTQLYPGLVIAVFGVLLTFLSALITRPKYLPD